jgi:hypothetical protein
MELTIPGAGPARPAGRCRALPDPGLCQIPARILATRPRLPVGSVPPAGSVLSVPALTRPLSVPSVSAL